MNKNDELMKALKAVVEDMGKHVKKSMRHKLQRPAVAPAMPDEKLTLATGEHEPAAEPDQDDAELEAALKANIGK